MKKFLKFAVEAILNRNTCRGMKTQGLKDTHKHACPPTHTHTQLPENNLFSTCHLCLINKNLVCVWGCVCAVGDRFKDYLNVGMCVCTSVREK